MVRTAADLCHLSLDDTQTIHIALIGPQVITRVDQEFLGHDGITDVISFNYSDRELGVETPVEILVCPDVAAEKAAEIGCSFAEELTLYIVHGLLHSTGLDDQTPAERKIMRKLEKKVMNELKQQFCLEKIFPQC